MTEAWIEYEGTEGTATIPTTADGWQLYADNKGAGKAARSLTGALKRALRASNRDKAIKIMSEALSKHSELGSSDGEPRGVAERCLTEGRGGDYSWVL